MQIARASRYDVACLPSGSSAWHVPSTAHTGGAWAIVDGFATPEECVRIFGYPPGSMPPLGLRGCASLAAKRGAASSSAGSAQNGSIPALMDAAVHALGSRDVYPGAGAPDRGLPGHQLDVSSIADIAGRARERVANEHVHLGDARGQRRRRADLRGDPGLELRRHSFGSGRGVRRRLRQPPLDALTRREFRRCAFTESGASSEYD